jgi:hypothetical protein
LTHHGDLTDSSSLIRIIQQTLSGLVMQSIEANKTVQF